MERQAVLSDCRTYRFVLVRSEVPLINVSDNGTVLFGLNNPSTADHNIDDATSRRGWAYAQRWGYNRMVFVNCNPWRSTQPELAFMPDEDTLAKNDQYIFHQAYYADLIVCAWGTRANRELAMRLETNLRTAALQSNKKVHVLALSEGGVPKHPLYLKGSLLPQVWKRMEKV